jgi:recombination protein RecT
MTNSTTVAPRRELTPAERKLKSVHLRLDRDTYKQALAHVLPRGVTPDAWARTALLAITKNTRLLNCTEESIAQAALQIAVWGLEIGRTAHMVPYGTEASPQVDYKGMIELAMRGRSITSCRAEVVYANDEFQVERGLAEKLVHRFDWQAERGEPIGAYAIVRFPRSQDQAFVLMSKREIEAHRDRYAKAYKRKPGERGPWETEPLEMWRKTVVRRLLKYVPQNPLLAAVLAYDEDEVASTDAEVLNALRPQPSALSHRAVDRADEYPALGPGAVELGEAGEETVTLPVSPPLVGAEVAGPKREVVEMANKPPLPPTPSGPDAYQQEGRARRRRTAGQQEAPPPREREPGEDDEDDLDLDRRLAERERRP